MKKLSKIFAVALVLTMVLSMLPMGAGAIAATAGATATLVTDASTLAAGDQIVLVAKNVNKALSTTQNSNNRGAADVTKSGNTVTLTANAEVLTLKAGSSAGSFALATADGSYLYAAGGTSSNYLRTGSTLDAKASFTITITSAGVATIKCADSATTKNWIRYNPNTQNSNPLFSCYASGQEDICIYKLTAAVQDTREDLPTSTSAIVDAIFDLNAGESLSKYYKYDSFNITGTITVATEVWSDQYNNGTVTIKIDGTNKELVAFRYKAGTVAVSNIKALAVGDKVTFKVESAKNYNGTYELEMPTLTAIEKAQTPTTTAPVTTTAPATTQAPAGTTAPAADTTAAAGTTPDTGDTTSVATMTAVMALAVTVLAVLVIGNKKKFF